MCTDTGIKTYTFNDSLAIQTLNFCVSIEFVEVAYTKSKVSVSKKFYGLGLLHAHKEGVNVFFQKCCESLSCFNQHINISYRFDSFVLCLKLGLIDDLGITYDDTAWVEVIVEGFALTKEFRRKKKIERLHSFLGILQIKVASVADRYG